MVSRGDLENPLHGDLQRPFTRLATVRLHEGASYRSTFSKALTVDPSLSPTPVVYATTNLSNSAPSVT